MSGGGDRKGTAESALRGSGSGSSSDAWEGYKSELMPARGVGVESLSLVIREVPEAMLDAVVDRLLVGLCGAPDGPGTSDAGGPLPEAPESGMSSRRKIEGGRDSTRVCEEPGEPEFSAAAIAAPATAPMPSADAAEAVEGSIYRSSILRGRSVASEGAADEASASRSSVVLAADCEIDASSKVTRDKRVLVLGARPNEVRGRAVDGPGRVVREVPVAFVVPEREVRREDVLETTDSASLPNSEEES